VYVGLTRQQTNKGYQLSGWGVVCVQYSLPICTFRLKVNKSAEWSYWTVTILQFDVVMYICCVTG